MVQPEFEEHEAEYWARQIRVGALIAAGITLLGAARVLLNWAPGDQWLLAPMVVAGLLQAATAWLPWKRFVRRVRTRRLLVAWWVAEIPVLFIFSQHDTNGMLLYLPGATLILVLATALFSPAVVICLGVVSVSGFLALLPFQSSVETVAVLGMVLIMMSVVAVNAIIAHNRGRLDARRRSAERRTEALLEHSSDLVVALAGKGRIRYASPSVAAALGRSTDQLTGDELGAMVHADDLPFVQDWIRQVWAAPAGQTSRTELRLRQADGSILFVDAIAANRLSDPDVQAVIVSLRDIGTRRALEQQLSFQAFTDSLTGLANRALFRERLHQAVTEPHDQPVTLVLIDLDDFKDINDELGHSAGDELLTILADRLRRRVRPNDTLARLGGDEFALMIHGGDTDTTALAERLLDDIRDPVQLASRELHLTASIGIADTRDGPLQPDELLRNADLAMYAVKRAGRNAHATFEPAMHAAALHEAQQRADLEQALIGEQFEVHYQPVINLATAELTGVEALVRWQHPREGLVGPVHFIHHAENSGLIVPLGRWILRQACRQLAQWQQSMPAAAGLRINVNLSARQFQHAGLLDDVTAAVQDAGIAPESLTLEITESMLMDDVDAAIEVLHALRRFGVRLAIDDFGTGYSSLSYLQRLPVDTIKIDRSFVEHVEANPDNLAMAEAIVDLGQTLGLSTVAEGIETPGQRDTLLRLGCEYGQGYLFSRPVDADQLARLLRAGTHSPASTPEDTTTVALLTTGMS
ncbi:putative bifunctional diguanylate cyclase/phosphodiesterase [Paractinoplanes maris]|uniref:putative bifunctional diguanylate cyclase/phosphodiesterase n=1 Tax=Paractinoplanes maris TaxID=1734446 RepID=UPI002022289C|nr:EAL domain-containing protein [Actinoplanes maris]